MNWFEGSIPEAIAAAKTRKAIFVVYVRDSSEASKTTDEVLSRRDVFETMDNGCFVAIKLENGTEDAKQFSQIYPLVLVPSLFFISGQTGVPLEVLGGPLTQEKLKQKMNKLISDTKLAADTNSPSPSASEVAKAPEDGGGSNSNKEEVAEACAAPQTSAALPEPATEEAKPMNEAAVVSPEAVVQEHEAAEASGTASDGEGSGLSLEEKVERAKALLAEKQSLTQREKTEEERRKEIDRRKMGQEMAKKRQQQEDEEIRAAARERRKDKEEDRLARERVKAQIAADRAEKEARAALLRGEAPAPSQAPAPSAAPAPQPASSSNISRLKFRLPDGSSSISQFPAEAPLSEVRQYIEQNVTLPFSTFTLASTVQHRPFTVDDYNTSLRDLGLVPSAILAVLPSTSSGPGRLVSTGGGIWDMLWFVLTPITFLFGLIQTYLLGRREPSTERTDEPQPKRPREDSSPVTRQRPTTAYGRRGEARFRQQGNIHRLQNDGEDDDENNTWNGNSTQQM
ncbi:hypothetical protein O3P69_016520 [Scylla paramamosain]|uniref:UBX domain-containing protein 4 n=2 Tax=Scylla paramamosain TaxID=85552 RepID=A0AAW0TDL4_SCYPA